MKIKIEIKHWASGAVLFEFEKENNTIRQTLEEAVRRGANLRYANLGYANLRYANLGYANLGYANLRYANLGSADLRYANLGSANLRYADLRSADLRSADLGYADLRSANLGYANLGSADLGYADLRYANLGSANLRSADLRYADLRYANLGSANLRSADLRYANLRSAKNLNGDSTDFWWHVHHEVLVEHLTEPVRARINYIKGFKPEHEIETRLRLMRPVLGKIPSTEKGWERLHKAECKKCPWNGKTIFPKT